MPSGKPYQYYIHSTNYGLYPVPNSWATIDIDYLKRLPTLTSSQSTEFPEDFDDAICSYAKYLAYLSVNKNEQAAISLQDYQAQTDTLIASYIYDDVVHTQFWYQRGGSVVKDNAIYFRR